MAITHQIDVSTPASNETSRFLPSPKSIDDLRPLRVPRGGVDRLNFKTVDTIEVVESGERIRDTVRLSGYYMIERATPTSSDWHDASVDIYMREMMVEGLSTKFGHIRASVNHDFGDESRGQVKSGTFYADSPIDSPKMCEMNAFMKFELPKYGLTVFNKEVIRLQHKINYIPPVGQGGGTGGEVEIGLYNTKDPDGPPVAFLRQVETQIGAWLTEEVR